MIYAYLVLGSLIVVAVYVVGFRDGRDAGVWDGEMQAAERQRRIINAVCDDTAWQLHVRREVNRIVRESQRV